MWGTSLPKLTAALEPNAILTPYAYTCGHTQLLTCEAGRWIERGYLDWHAHMLHAVVFLFKQQGTCALVSRQPFLHYRSFLAGTGHFWQVTPGGTASFRHLCQFMVGTHNDSLIGWPHLLLFLLGVIQPLKAAVNTFLRWRTVIQEILSYWGTDECFYEILFCQICSWLYSVRPKMIIKNRL